MNSLVLIPATVESKRLASTLQGAASRPGARVSVVLDRNTWNVSSSPDSIDVVVERPYKGDFPLCIHAYGDPTHWEFMGDVRAFYRLLDRWARALAMPLTILDGPAPQLGKRFLGNGAWEWVKFESDGDDGGDEEVFALVRNGRDGVVDDDEVKRLSDTFGQPLEPEDLTHVV